MTKPKTRLPGIGGRIKAARNAAGLTQQKTADSLGMTLRSYQSYEDGSTEPSLNNLVGLCVVFGVTADHLLGIAPEASSD